jgi:quercetin dioxygenase-like cupin family protein
VPLGVGIPIHQHMQFDEAFYVLEGTGTFILDDTRHVVGKGSTIFIPKGAWHGFENPSDEMLLLWVVSPPGLEAFFRAVADTPGKPPKPPLTSEQLNAIAGKHGTFYRL